MLFKQTKLKICMGYFESPKWAFNSGIGLNLFKCYFNVWLRQLNVKPAEPFDFLKNNGALNSAMGYFESPKWAFNSGIGLNLFKCYFIVWLRQLNVKPAEPIVFLKNKGALNSAIWH